MRIIIKQIIFACSFLLTGNYLSAQQTDSVTSENLSINEVKLIKDQQQKQIDSLVKIQLEAQLRDAIGDKSKTRELEAKLREIAVNDSLRSIQQAAEIKKLKVDAKAYPVILNHDTLFNIFTRTGSFSARERALAITKKINSLYDDAFYSPDSLKIKSATDNFDIIYKNQEIIMTVSNLDGLWFGKTNAELAQSYLHTIKQTVQR
ncbi:MAG: mechanosensitive ion channel family protein, partial [Chryseobacterium sp.]